MKQSIFRNIRRKLLDEGKLVRYLTYAIGEVVLIIVGILFALKINDWNEDQKAQVEFDEYVVQLREDVKAAIDQNKKVAEYTAEQANTGFNVITFLEQPEYSEEEYEVFKNNLSQLGHFRETQYDIGLLGELLGGNMDTIRRDPDLLKKIMSLTSFLKLNQDIGNHIKIALSNDQQRLVQFRGPASSIMPEMQMRFDLDQLRTSTDFVYITQSILTRKSTLSVGLYNMIAELQDFLAVLEEYDTP